MTDAEFQDAALAHLLGELDPSGEAQFERELALRGDSGWAELRGLQSVLGDLALAVEQVAPPDSLRERVLAGIAVSGRAGGAPAPAGVRELPLRRSLLPWAAAAVFAALALGLGVRAARLSGDRDRLAAAVERLEGEIEERGAAADSTRESLAAIREDLDLVGASSSAVHGLAATGPIPDASARVFVDPETGRALLFAFELPVLSPQQLYELWAIGADGPRPAGVFRPDDRGRARLEITDVGVLEGAEILAVTIEPAPGTKQPTGEIVLASGRL